MVEGVRLVYAGVRVGHRGPHDGAALDLVWVRVRVGVRVRVRVKVRVRVLPLTAGTMTSRLSKRVPPPASGVDRYMKKV